MTYTGPFTVGRRAVYEQQLKLLPLIIHFTKNSSHDLGKKIS